MLETQPVIIYTYQRNLLEHLEICLNKIIILKYYCETSVDILYNCICVIIMYLWSLKYDQDIVRNEYKL